MTAIAAANDTAADTPVRPARRIDGAGKNINGNDISHTQNHIGPSHGPVIPPYIAQEADNDNSAANTATAVSRRSLYMSDIIRFSTDCIIANLSNNIREDKFFNYRPISAGEEAKSVPIARNDMIRG